MWEVQAESHLRSSAKYDSTETKRTTLTTQYTNYKTNYLHQCIALKSFTLFKTFYAY